jgi:hypothetical protein
MGPESPSPYPQVPATCPYPEPTPSSLHDPLQLPEDTFILPSTSWSPQWPLSLRLPHQHPLRTFPPPYAPHALPISFVSILPPAQYWVRSTDHSAPRCYHHTPTVKPEAATAFELLMMGVRTPETCCAVHTSKRQVINLRGCCIWLVDLFENLK